MSGVSCAQADAPQSTAANAQSLIDPMFIPLFLE
jgi:hypothetical protein